MIAHLPLFSHTDPKDVFSFTLLSTFSHRRLKLEEVLIVGGGDGAVVSQVAKHKTVKSITLCEIGIFLHL